MQEENVKEENPANFVKQFLFFDTNLTLKLAGYFAKHIQARGGGGGFVDPPQEF